MKRLSPIFLTATALALGGPPTAMAQRIGLTDEIIISRGRQRHSAPERRDGGQPASSAVAQRPAGETDYVFTPKERHDGEAVDSHNETKIAEKTPATVPLAEAKKNYQQKERQLRDLAEGKADLFRFDIEAVASEKRLTPLGESLDDQRKLDRVRQAVAEAFDARQQLQAAELAELERRIASIKRAMALRETMKETIIDQRTEELIEQIEAAENQPKQQQGGAATTPNKASSQSQAPGYPGATREMIKGSNGGETEIARQKRHARQRQQQILEIDVEEAQAKLDLAERAYKRFEQLLASGAIDKAVFDEEAADYKQARIRLEAAKVHLEAFLEAHRANAAGGKAPATTEEVIRKVPIIVNSRLEERIEHGLITKKREEGKPTEAKPADRPNTADSNSTEDANLGVSARKRLLELDVEEATAKLDAAQRDYERVKALHDTGAVEQSILDQKGKDHEIAKIQLERAKVKLEAFEKRSNQGSRQPADGSAAEIDTNERLAQLDVEEAEANLAAVEIQYERCKRLYESNSIQKSLLDEQADKYHRAQKQLERAKIKLKALSNPSTSALAPASEKPTLEADAKDSLSITLVETGDGKPAAVYLGDGKAGTALPGTPDEQDDEIRQAVEQGVNAGMRSVLIKADKGAPHRDVARVAEAAGSVGGVSVKLAVAEGGARSEDENAR